MPSPVNLPDILLSVDDLFAEWGEPNSPGCTVAVIRDGGVIYQKGFGMANLEYDIPNQPGTIYHVASISKQFTAFAIQILAREGKVNLDDEVHKYLPELHDFGYSLTLRHLIHHTSGLRDQWNLLGIAGWRSVDVITEEDILKVVWRQRELNFEPGTEISYSNTGYTLLAQVVQRVSGMPFRQFCQECIFAPLRMVHTHFHDDNKEIVKGRAYCYSPSALGGFQNVPLQYANVGATSLFTTVEDMARWDRNFDAPKVGDAALISEMHKVGVLNDGAELDYASGLTHGHYRGLPTVGHDGADAGFRTAYRRFPDQRFAVLVFANLSSFNPSLLVNQIADLFLGDLMKPVEVSESVSPSVSPTFEIGSDALREYLGDYYSYELGIICSIWEEDGKLRMDFPKGVATLEPSSEDAFNAHPIGLMTFERSLSGVTGFRLDNGRVRRLLFEVWRR
jgi:CubicO group peptidase (beta-lactamase class C family)